ncbi:MAG: DNA-binding proteins Bright/BRCAA1/RBP1 and proteins containing BRIGHT domain [Alyxoria varia]|nr:MAG: DNA-binding proteins Bright/BRCAA1/RBP1 and proteins containing BRIGHT domain [Alyxoria varia]
MATVAPQVSSISQAFANTAGAVDIPKPRAVVLPNKEMAAKAVARDVSGPMPGHGSGLPTPPNSISPNISAVGLMKRGGPEGRGTPPPHVESDIDLQDAIEHANSQGRVHLGPPGTDSCHSDDQEVVTSDHLLRYHLAEVVLQSGPIAIKHLMNSMNRLVPGFHEVPPSKARRIIVAALESQQAGNADGDVEFEKVGWGRWSAKRRVPGVKGASVRHTVRGGQLSPPDTASLVSSNSGMNIPRGNRPPPKPRRESANSWALESRSVPEDKMDVDSVEEEVRRMSLEYDEDEPPERRAPGKSGHEEWMDPESDTDVEDWSTMGAAALKGDCSASFAGNKSAHFRPHRRRAHHVRKTKPQNHNTLDYHGKRQDLLHLDFTGVDADSQEREAIEALMHMSSTS